MSPNSRPHSSPASLPTLIITENNCLYREAIAQKLMHAGTKVLATAANGKELLFELKNHKPDIILLDIEMPIMDGSETLTILRQNYPKIKIVILSALSDATLIHNFISRGASAFIDKNSLDSVDDILNILLSVFNQGSYYKNLPKPQLYLTVRELELVIHTSAGMDTKQIAAKMKISAFSVNKHRASLYKKTNTSKLEELMHFVCERNFRFLKHTVIQK